MAVNAVNETNNSEQILWKNRNFMLIWGGSAISSFGMQMYIIAIPLLIYSMSQSALAMSTMRAIDFFPNILLGIIAGVFVDRFNRKKMMQWTSLIQAISASGIVLLLISHELQLWHLYLLGFILSSAGYTFGNAHHSVLPQIVPKQQLTSANAKMSFVGTLIQTAGPGIAGILLAVFSYSSILTIYTVCLFAMFLCIHFVQLPSNGKIRVKKEHNFKNEMKEGLAELFQNKTLLVPTITILFINFASSLVIGVLVFYVTDQLHATESQVGLMFSISAIGGLVGALVISRIRQHVGRGIIFTACLFIDVLAMTALIFAPTWWLIGISLAVRTFSTTLSNIVYFTIRQEFTPNHLLGRVAGTSSMFMKLTLPLGLFIAGLWAEWLPIPVLFIFSALIFLVLFVRLAFHPFRELV
ncbi:MFS transporter [Virgibacillus kimchii]